MLIFSDLHLRDETAELVLGTILPGIQRDALKQGENTIACLGDVLHFRYRVPAPLLNGLRDWCMGCVADGLELIFLPGNHDQYDITGRNALEPLGSIGGVSVYTMPTENRYGLWIPYRKNPDDIRGALSTAPVSADSLLFLHHGIRGAWMNDNMQNNEGLQQEELQAFDQVLTGHYHRHHQVGNATYIGSPYQTKADESGQEKGYVLLSGGKIEFVPKQWGKRYHRITLQPGENLDLSDVGEGDDVRVRTATGVDPVAVGKQLEEAGVAHTVTPDQGAPDLRLDVAPGAGMADYARAYVDAKAPEGLDVERLLQTYTEAVADG